MRFSWILWLACASVLSLLVGWCEATPLPFSIATENSGDQDLEMLVTTPSATSSYADMAPLHTTPRVLTHSPVQPSDSTAVEHFLLTQMRSFLQDNLVLVLLVSSLMAGGIFLVCCASAVSRQRKFAAYYPASFPATCYVDQSDKAGGEPAFRQVPNRSPDTLAPEPRDSAHQLQQEILTATRKLRTPTKTPTGGRGTQSTKHSPLDMPQSQRDTPQAEETLTKTEQKVPSTKIEQDVTPTKTDQEVAPTETEQEITPTKTEQEVAPTKTEQEVVPTETEQEVTPTKTEQEVAPAETEQEVTPTKTEQEVVPTETEQNVPPTETEQEVVPTETEQEVVPTETDQEVKESLQEADLSQSAESEEVSGIIKELGAQQEVRSSPAESQELGASPVKLISGETTAF